MHEDTVNKNMFKVMLVNKDFWLGVLLASACVARYTEYSFFKFSTANINLNM